MTWVVGGLALSEMPAILLVTVNILLFLRSIDRIEQGQSPWVGFGLAAVILAAACWGRQTYLVLLAMPVVLTVARPQIWKYMLAYLFIVIILVAPLFVIWAGFTPPSHHRVQQGFSLIHAILSLGYTGLAVFIVAPRLPGRRRFKWMTSVVTATVIYNVITGSVSLLPLGNVLTTVVPVEWLDVYGRVIGGVFASVGLVFAVWLLASLWKNRKDLKSLTIGSGLLSLALSPGLVAHQYSSRYTAMALPFIVLASAASRRSNWMTPVAYVAGCGAGFAALNSYFRALG